ncbi:phage head spike fiber domain-containing protein [Thalassospira sp. CH_XMU1458]|uniref:phage head spike fiber domain-containing protein n=1 Tax=Thalassospira sp. CH_XMU1458 TaxID=3107776 RepID=UPI00300D5A39
MGLRYQPLSACMNVSRASTKLVHGRNGLLETRAIDEPAYDHDRLGRRLGLLIEGAATNLLRYSLGFDNALWEKNSGVVVSASTIAAPDGSQTAMQLDLPGTSGGADGLYQNVGGLVASQTYSFAVWMRAVSGTADITLGGIDGASAHGFTLDQNWQRVWIAEPASGTTRYPKISTAITALPASILIWNAQLETGPAPTSDIISKGIPAARAVDDVRLDPGDWFAQGRGTMVFDLHTTPDWAGIWRIVQLYSLSLNDDHLDLGYDSAADQLRISLRSGGVPVVTQSLYGTLAKDSRHRIALAWDDDVISVGLDGVVLSSPDGFAMPRNFSNIVLGSFGGTDKALNGHVRNLAYWPEMLSNARLSELSTV